MKPTVLYRIASVLLIFLATGHTIAILKFLSTLLAICVGLAAWGIQGAKP